MKQLRNVCKVVRIGAGIGLIIPSSIVRDLKVSRGDHFELLISDRDTIVARRLETVGALTFGEARDNSLPKIKYGK